VMETQKQNPSTNSLQTVLDTLHRFSYTTEKGRYGNPRDEQTLSYWVFFVAGSLLILLSGFIGFCIRLCVDWHTARIARVTLDETNSGLPSYTEELEDELKEREAAEA
jgi:hypothetical protein